MSSRARVWHFKNTNIATCKSWTGYGKTSHVVGCKLFSLKVLLGCKLPLYNPLEVEPKSLLESLRIRVFHRRVVAVHVVSREATLLAAHLGKFS